jgi:hypothetical protein
MLTEFRRKPLITLGAREHRVIRHVLVAMSVLVIAQGVVLLTVRGLPGFEVRTAIGLWFVLLGAGMALFAWRGRWTPVATEEEKARDERLTRRFDILVAGAELLFLSLALLGLLVPSVFRGLWEEYRSSVTLFLALAALDVTVRLVRFARRRSAESAKEPA